MSGPNYCVCGHLETSHYQSHQSTTKQCPHAQDGLIGLTRSPCSCSGFKQAYDFQLVWWWEN